MTKRIPTASELVEPPLFTVSSARTPKGLSVEADPREVVREYSRAFAEVTTLRPSTVSESVPAPVAVQPETSPGCSMATQDRAKETCWVSRLNCE